MSAALLTATQCTRHFGGLAAVNSVSFSVGEGEIFGLIGPNGAGKTTMLNLIAGVHTLSSGSLHFRGHDITHLPTYGRTALGIARTFQIPQPLFGLTVLENVAVGAMFGRNSARRPTHEAMDLAASVLEQVSLENQARRPVDQLNLAQRKRLELARALATEPDLLLLDEVMAGLNHTEIDFVMEMVRKLNAAGITIIIVEHIMKVIMAISQRILVMHHGEQIAAGAPAEVAADPRVIEAYLGQRFAARQAALAEGGGDHAQG